MNTSTGKCFECNGVGNVIDERMLGKKADGTAIVEKIWVPCSVCTIVNMQYEQKKKELVELYRRSVHKNGCPSFGTCERCDVVERILDDMARYVRSVMEVEERKVDFDERAKRIFKKIKPADAFDDGFNSARTTAQKQADDSGIPKSD